MDRVNTAIWENNKFEHNHCLCYSEAKGLYVKRISLASKDEVLFLPHVHKGFWKNKFCWLRKILQFKLKRISAMGVGHI